MIKELYDKINLGIAIIILIIFNIVGTAYGFNSNEAIISISVMVMIMPFIILGEILYLELKEKYHTKYSAYYFIMGLLIPITLVLYLFLKLEFNEKFNFLFYIGVFASIIIGIIAFFVAKHLRVDEKQGKIVKNK